MNIKDWSIQCAKAVMLEHWLSATWLPALQISHFGYRVSDYLAELKTMQLYFKTKQSKNPVQEVSDAEDLGVRMFNDQADAAAQSDYRSANVCNKPSWEEESNRLLRSAPNVIKISEHARTEQCEWPRWIWLMGTWTELHVASDMDGLWAWEFELITRTLPER